MILKTWIDKPRGMLLVEEDIPHRGGGACWTPLRWGSGSEGELVDTSRSEDHRKVQAVDEVKKKMHAADEEVKKERHSSCNARRCWSKAKIARDKIDH